jgi:hypothetical protein
MDYRLLVDRKFESTLEAKSFLHELSLGVSPFITPDAPGITYIQEYLCYDWVLRSILSITRDAVISIPQDEWGNMRQDLDTISDYLMVCMSVLTENGCNIPEPQFRRWTLADIDWTLATVDAARSTIETH